MRSLPHAIVVFAIIMAVLLGRELFRKPKPSPENGQLIGRLYTNSTFGFTVLVPTNWRVFHQAQLEHGIHTNLPKPRRIEVPFAGGSYELPDVEVHHLLTTSEDAASLTDGTMTPTNATFSILAQNVSYLPQMESGRNVLATWLGAFETIQHPDEGNIQGEGPKEVSVGGREFYRDTFRVQPHGVPVVRRLYARIERGYALMFVLIAPNDAELDRVEMILATAHFN